MCWEILLILALCLHRGHCFCCLYSSCQRSLLLHKHNPCTITGVEIIRCRPFSIHEPKAFKFCGSYCSVEEMPTGAYPEVAFVGRSNVGKSSLLNALTGQRKQVATENLPGYGYAKLSQKEKTGISSFVHDYLVARKSLKLVVLLLDARRQPNNEDQDLLQFLLESGLRVAVAVTKSDKIRKGELQGIPSAMRALLAPVACAPELVDLNLLPITPVSSATGEGKTELWKIIRNSLLAEE